MSNTYIIPVDEGDMQDAISTELGVSVDADIAQEVLDSFIEPTDVTAPIGCCAQEESLSMMLALMKQIGEHKGQIIQFIDEAGAA